MDDNRTNQAAPPADRSKLLERLDGVVAVPVTPSRRSDGGVDPDAVRHLAHRIDAAGIHAIAVLGNVGEVHQLTAAERTSVLTSTADGCAQAALIAGVTGPVREAVETAAAAAELGYDAVMLHEPADTFARDDGLVDYATSVADASPLPVVLYARTHRWGIAQLAEAAAHPNVVAMKYAVTEPASLLAVLTSDALRQACRLVCGAAETSVPVFAGFGVTGFTSGIANVRPSLPLRLWRHVRDADWTAFWSLYRELVPFEQIRLVDGGRFNIATVKAALTRDGLDVGGVRSPCVPLDDHSRRSLEQVMRRWDELDRPAEPDGALGAGRDDDLERVGSLAAHEPLQQ